MSVENMSVTVGDTVRLDDSIRYPTVGGLSRMLRVPDSIVLTVTRVYTDTFTARGPGWTVRSHKSNVTHVNEMDRDGNRYAPPRELGVQPADTPEMTYIGIDDPRIQWLFEDMAKYADEAGWCSEYDELCEGLGIPGRNKDWDVEVYSNFLETNISATIRATSESEARDVLRGAILS